MYFAGVDGIAERFRCITCGARPWRFCTGVSYRELEQTQTDLRLLAARPATPETVPA